MHQKSENSISNPRENDSQPAGNGKLIDSSPSTRPMSNQKAERREEETINQPKRQSKREGLKSKWRGGAWRIQKVGYS